MIKQTLNRITLVAALVASPITAVMATGSHCMPIGGVGMPNFVPETDGTITIVAPLTGSAETASGKITGQKKTATGLEMDMDILRWKSGMSMPLVNISLG
ncbi:MAG TPA: hypothetical protein ENJ80_09735 [Gammaproteobacteria bacterium]|nr:hypothetical protein [Gammaproteobacteria bacterium]